MSSQQAPEWFDGALFIESCNRFPPEELEKYRGQWVAWSLDGTRIIAHAHDLDTLYERVLQAGEPVNRCVAEGIPAADTIIGWGALDLGCEPWPLEDPGSP
jgi:hypothetical protein